MMNPFEKSPSQVLDLRLFDDREPDPHRVRFWRVRVSLDGLWIQPDHEPLPPEPATARWHEVFDLLQARPALLEERDEVEAELRSLRLEVERERMRLVRLHRVIDARQAQLDALALAPTSARPGVLTLVSSRNSST